jgi:hypothetical protein
MLNREQILALDDLQREPVEIPEWQGTYYVRMMTGEEKSWLEAQMVDANGEDLPHEERISRMRACTAVVTTCHADGTAVFVLADAARLAKKAANALDRIWDVASRLNKLTQHEVDALTKNSEPAQNGDSG